MRKTEKEKLLDIYNRIAGLHIDLEELQNDDEISDLTHTYSFISLAADALEKFLKSKHISVI